MHSKSAKKDGMHVSHLATTAPALLCCRCHGLKVGFNMATSTYQAAPPHKTAPALLCCRCHGGSLPRPSRSPTDSTSTTMLPVLQTKFMNNYISFNVYIITPVPFMMSVNPPWFRGSKSNVSRFLRLRSCNGLDAKPAGALPFRMRSRRSFLTLCLVADPRSG